ncbi:hypothetical protein CORC01_03461 [Colletotrichum orchidophilum]|uniref:Uncharacterized protein n=1 Tax=Colletotrichum orchidophilum TaxID=1209926 RepID=A0A1G4BIN7_9PEZI|nr:uncharacterized protein CORC01_03461 [Colletotrichum orchidophilum]OHF01147.1 hypothetical protein CORC01_03461 [Colletotrichum orchidophilum]
MPSSKGYSYNSSGSNSQGNHYCARDYGSSSSSNPNSYQYTNTNGSFHYSTLKGDKYQNDSNTSASGYRTCSGYGKK